MFQAFQTTGRACYRVEEVTPDHAEQVGCPDANARILTIAGPMYGYFSATGSQPGRQVRVPAWYSRRGVRVVFVAATGCPSVHDEDASLIDGWAD